MADPEHQNNNLGLLDVGDDSIRANAVFPKAGQIFFERFGITSRVFARGRALPQKRMLSRTAWRSIPANCFFAVSASLICQAKLVLHFVERVGPLLAPAYSVQGLLGQVNVFQVVQIFQNSLAGVIGFRPAGALGQIVKTLFDVLG